MGKSNSKRRVTSANANQRLPLRPSPYTLSPYDASRQLSFDFTRALRELEDRRSWHPLGEDRPAETVRRSQRGFTVSSTPRATQQRRPGRRQKFYHPMAVAFVAPRETLICVRRQRRKEVLHAKKKTGRGGQRKPRFNQWSKVRCK